MALFQANNFGFGSGLTVAVVTETFDGAADVDPDTDQITITAHGFSDGDVVRLTEGAGTAPAGLQDDNVYAVKVVDVNTIQLSPAGAANLALIVDITADGSGTITLDTTEVIDFPRGARICSIAVRGTNMNVKYCYDLLADVQLWVPWDAGAVSVLTDATFDGGFDAIAIEGVGNYSYNWD